MSDKRAIIDIGSNTVRLVVYNGPPRAPVVLLNEKVTPRLGRDVAKTGLLSEKSVQVALTALRRYSALLDLMDVNDVQTVATAAVRDAENGREFLDAVTQLGLSPRLLSGKEEAQTSAMGVIAAFPGASGMAGDLGGGSLELTAIRSEACGEGVTLPFGTLRLAALREEGEAAFAKQVRNGLQAVEWTHGRGEPFFIVGGSWRALALYAMYELGWPLEDPHDFELSPKDAARICGALAQGKLDETAPRISSSRLAMLPDAAALLAALVAEIEPSRIVFSSWGLREGLLYSTLDEKTRALDPMLEGVTAFTQTYSVSSETAKHVSGWIAGVAPKSRKADAKLRQAAAMLALASMRNEPNMRAEQAMDWALRKRWIGLDSRGRALIAMAVLANTGRTETPEEFSGLAKESELKWAVAWGLAIRLCRKLTNCTEQAIAASALTLGDGQLVLRLEESASNLYSGSVEKNLCRLADWLGVEAEIEGVAARA